jgi:hypothetical protein
MKALYDIYMYVKLQSRGQADLATVTNVVTMETKMIYIYIYIHVAKQQ